MNQADLTRRFDALQDSLMELYEAGETNLEAQIKHWKIIRKQYVYMYYARKEGYKHLGLQPLPTLLTSEYKAKEAIQQLILLESLQKSSFRDEEWTLSDTSAELTLTAPRNTFKKMPFIVDVWFDHLQSNSFPYTNWDRIYYQDEGDNWHVAQGKADVNGLYFDDYTGQRNYFTLFAPDGERFSSTGEWTVNFKNETISSVNSSQGPSSNISPQGFVTSSGDAVPRSTTFPSRRDKGKEGVPSSTTPSTPELRRGRRRREQRESPSRRRPKRVRQNSGGVSPSEVGRGTSTVPRSGLTRTQRLTEEARDPPILIVKGGANNLKCWRYRHKNSSLFDQMSTVFKWVGHDSGNRMLISFRSIQQRSLFLKVVHFPKGCTYALGYLDSL